MIRNLSGRVSDWQQLRMGPVSVRHTASRARRQFHPLARFSRLTVHRLQ